MAFKEKKERNRGNFSRRLPNGKTISFKYQEDLDGFCAFMSHSRFPTLTAYYAGINRYLKRAG